MINLESYILLRLKKKRIIHNIKSRKSPSASWKAFSYFARWEIEVSKKIYMKQILDLKANEIKDLNQQEESLMGKY